MDDLSASPCGSSEDIAAGQLWHFVLVMPPQLPDHWTFQTLDDGGHHFEFFWWPLHQAADVDWHPIFVRALAFAADVARAV